jgi:hypothetical protein
MQWGQRFWRAEPPSGGGILALLSAIFGITISARSTYVELAVSLAADLPGLAALRAGLRERMASSPLCDGPRFAINFMQLLRGVWRDWCCRQPVPRATLATG